MTVKHDSCVNVFKSSDEEVLRERLTQAWTAIIDRMEQEKALTADG